ncbi:MAG: heparan-alpha-glucosaminide N-acetyltransferase domain-containing protein [Gemmatimonadaceae bacterium]
MPVGDRSTGTSSDRLWSIDVVRGLACVLMAIDHVRVYSGLPAGGPTAGIFLTRWVTHFVAPAFCLFAGTAAYFLGQRLGNAAQLRRFLVTRGLLLVALELTVIRFLWSFNANLAEFSLAGVIWMLGWCMVLLALFVTWPARRVGWVGVGIVVLQQLAGLLPRVPGLRFIASPWAFIYPTGAAAPLGVDVLYVLVPWIGVMMAGYGFGELMERPDPRRRQLLLRLGAGMIAVFAVLATVLAMLSASSGGESGFASAQRLPLWMRVLGQQKYPASQLFLLMTLGPTIALLPWAEQWRGWLGRALNTFGRVPMWYYLMHLLVIHSFALLVTALRTGAAHGEWYATAPYTRVPPEGVWTLGLLYAVWTACIVVLYPLCAWYAGRKARAPSWWMRYL